MRALLKNNCTVKYIAVAALVINFNGTLASAGAAQTTPENIKARQAARELIARSPPSGDKQTKTKKTICKN